MRRLRGSVLGLGSVGRHHARILEQSSRVDLVGAVELNGADASIAPDRLHRSWEELNHHTAVDFAVIALPTALHEQASVTVAGDGASVLVEKPLALSRREAHAIVDALASAGVHGAVAHVERYNPAVLELRRLIREGAVGKPRAIVSERGGPLPLRARETGVIGDLATHDLDLIPWLVGERIEHVYAQADASESESVAAITGRLTGDLVFNTVADWLSPVKSRRVRVLGDAGSLVADLIAPQLLHVDKSARQIPLPHAEPLAVQFDAFCDLLEGRAEAAVVTLEEGLAAVAAADAALRSAREGQPVSL